MFRNDTKLLDEICVKINAIGNKVNQDAEISSSNRRDVKKLLANSDNFKRIKPKIKGSTFGPAENVEKFDKIAECDSIVSMYFDI